MLVDINHKEAEYLINGLAALNRDRTTYRAIISHYGVVNRQSIRDLLTIHTNNARTLYKKLINEVSKDGFIS